MAQAPSIPTHQAHDSQAWASESQPDAARTTPPPSENPGVQLGLAMGLAGLEGRDKVTLFASPDVADFGAWAEQLIAESTGKDGKGDRKSVV